MFANQVHTELRLQSLPTWHPEQYRRILILAPHPDDEVLAAGGVIATALASVRPPQIQVAVVTGGGGSYSTVWLNGHNPASHRSFQHMAVERQRESAGALASLGLSPDRVHFWGFPDRGLEPIWRRHWTGDAPYRSRTTELTASAPAAHSPATPYTSGGLLALLRRTLADFRPDALIAPHPRDAHPDHRALARFASLAVALNQAHALSPAPDLFGYVVWLRGNPRPASLHLGRYSLRLPERLTAGYAPWLRLSLTRAAVERKALALQYYRSQARPMGPLLHSRAESYSEVFARLRPYRPLRPDWQTWPCAGRRWAAAPVALWSAADRANLWLAAQLSRPPHKGFDYTFVVRTVHGQPVEIRVPASEFVPTASGGVLATARLPLADLDSGRPGSDQALAAALETRLHHRIVAARSDWQLLYVTKGSRA